MWALLGRLNWWKTPSENRMCIVFSSCPKLLLFFRQNRFWGCDVVLFQHNKLITVQQNKLMVYCGRIYNSNTLSLNFRRGISLFCFYYALFLMHNRNQNQSYWDELRIFLFHQQNENALFLFCVQNKRGFYH